MAVATRKREGWLDPPQWVYVKNNPHEREVVGGVMRGGLEYCFVPYQQEQVRLLCRCIKCGEGHQPYPTVCAVCGFMIKKHQTRLLGLWDAGEAKKGRDYGSSVDLDKEVDRLDAELEEDNWVEHPTLGIVVPKGA